MRTSKLRESLTYLRDKGISIATIVDVGVQHSTPVLLNVFPDLPHVLFEPIMEYYPHIHKNYRGLTYQLVQAAVSDVDGEVILHSEKKNRGQEVSHSYIIKVESPCSRKVPSLTLDSYHMEHNLAAPILLKVDVEGADVPSKIIRGAASLLEQTSVVVMEMTVDKFVERASLLNSAGFDVWDITDLCYYDNCLWQADVVFIKRQLKNGSTIFRPMAQKPFRPELWQNNL